MALIIPGHSSTLLWTLGFMVCTVITLVPSPLIEPRYFLVPTVILRIQLQRQFQLQSGAIDQRAKKASPAAFAIKGEASRPTRYAPDTVDEVAIRPIATRIIWAEWGWYTLINGLTLALFLGRKFRWDGWEGWMRIMW
jgi:alpha-1,2-glucosyltransferase